MRNLILFIGCLFVVFMGTSCVKQGEVDIPSYLVVDTTMVSAAPEEGSESSRFPFVWVYADNEFLGGYPVGKRIPILQTGEVEIYMRPGTYTNGQVVHTDVYYMMKPYIQDVELKRGEDTHISPVFEYEDYITFSLVEDFEDGNIFKQDFDSNPSTKLVRTQENVFEGQYSGLLEVSRQDSANSVAAVTPIIDFAKKGEALMFLELDYMNATDLVVGIIGLTEGGGEYNRPLISLKPRDDYHKIYIDLTEDIVETRATTVSLYFIVTYNREYDDNPGGSSQKVYIDNVKIINN